MLKFKNGEDFYNKIYLNFNAFIAISLLPFSLVFLDIHKNGTNNSIINGYLAYSLIIVSVIVILYYAYQSFEGLKKFRKKVDTSLTLRQKLVLFHKIFLKHYITLSSLGVFITVVLYLTRNNLLVVCYVIILVLLSLNRPTLKSIISELKLSKNESDILYQKLEIEN